MTMTAAQIAALDRADPNSLPDALRDISIGTMLAAIEEQLGGLDDATVVAALTGAGGGTANGSLVDEGTLSTSGGNTYSDAAVNTVLGKLKDNVAEIAAKVEAIRAALVTGGVLADS
jgi:hypothetical protein